MFFLSEVRKASNLPATLEKRCKDVHVIHFSIPKTEGINKTVSLTTELFSQSCFTAVAHPCMAKASAHLNILVNLLEGKLILNSDQCNFCIGFIVCVCVCVYISSLLLILFYNKFIIIKGKCKVCIFSHHSLSPIHLFLHLAEYLSNCS